MLQNYVFNTLGEKVKELDVNEQQSINNYFQYIGTVLCTYNLLYIIHLYNKII